MTRATLDNSYRSQQSESVLIDGSNSANWVETTGTGVTKATDSSITWDGANSTRFSIPGTTSGTVNIGTSTSLVTVPYWNGSIEHQRLGVIFQCSDISRLTAVSLLIGDSGFTNYYQGSTFTFGWQNNEWIAATKGTPTWTANGSPTWYGSKRIRIALSIAAGSDMTINVAKVVLAPRARPAIVFSIDDGYAECLTFLDVEFTARGIPCSYSIDPYYIDTPGYLTSAQLDSLIASPFADINNHGYLNQKYLTDISKFAYLQNAIYTRDWLRARGVGQGALYHVFVGGGFDGPLLRAFDEAGFLFGRNTNTPRYQHPYWDANYSINRMNVQLLGGLDNTLTLAQAKALVDQVETAGEVGFFNGHKFAAAAGTLQWAFTDMTDLLDYIVAKAKQGRMDVLCVSDYVRGILTGGRRVRR